MSNLINLNTVLINGVTVAVVGKPVYKRGVPKIEVSTATVGNKISTYQNVNYEEATGMVKISIQPTKTNIELIEGWQDNIGKNSIRLLDATEKLTKTFNQMSIEEDLEIDTSAPIEITFMGGTAS